MNIGEKIRELRVSKLMTQSELAGTHMTRNMLSCIENGSANPSLSTVLYIAERLNVPAGFLLAEEGDEIVYRKMTNFANIRQAYLAGDLRGCMSLCLSVCPEPDDELCLLLANCDAGIGEEEFRNGKLRSACRFFDEALRYTARTIYPADELKAKAAVYFQYMERISPTLYSDFLDREEESPAFSWNSDFARYTAALCALDEGDPEPANAFLRAAEENSFYMEHLRICLLMEAHEYRSAEEELLSLLRAETPLGKTDLYAVLCGLEICCRETENFKDAYNYANEKIELLEELLSEI